MKVQRIRGNVRPLESRGQFSVIYRPILKPLKGSDGSLLWLEKVAVRIRVTPSGKMRRVAVMPLHKWKIATTWPEPREYCKRCNRNKSFFEDISPICYVQKGKGEQ